MAHRHDDNEKRGRATFDGALVCGLCVDNTPRIDNDWCPVTECVMCDECCRGLMMGEGRALVVASEIAGRELTAEDVVAECTSCPRLMRLVTEHTLEGETDVRLPMH
jgi:hypothetical protein